MRRIGKFEWKIVLALLLTAAAPLLFTAIMVDRLVGESMSVGVNDRVLDALRQSVDLYKEVIETRLRLARTQILALADDEAFLKAVQKGAFDEVREPLRELLQTPAIQRVRLLRKDSVLVEEERKPPPDPAGVKSRSDVFDLPGGERIEAVLVIARSFLEGADSLRELVVTLESFQTNFQPWKLAYYRVFLFIYFWILLMAVVLGYLLARSVTRRVAQLVSATRRATTGDLAVRVPVRGRDEIGSLAESFNRMLDEIQRTRDRIVYLEKVSSWQEIARRLAHEIKNPLTPIQLAMQELHKSYRGEDSSFTAKLDQSLEIVEEEVATLRRMVETFSEFAKLPDVQTIPVELNEFAADFLRKNPQFASRVSLQPLRERLEIRLDPMLMGRVLMNLVNNALDASPGGEPVEIRVGREGEFGVLQVADRGVGLSEEARGRLFQPYFTTKAHGTGLGLAIVKKIVLQHGGEIFARDNPPRGTVFCVRLRAGSTPPANA
ncbi:MAG: HAMP domain-containing protein [Myxococcales bacterium]|nr:HAMP domain-containing protein [Myxococcales bacterium]